MTTGVRAYLPKTSGTDSNLILLNWSPSLISPVGIACLMGLTDGALRNQRGGSEDNS
ncbi:MAG: hypothetical protein KKD21_11955 [Proteobacteria bacterium]|nr:hypothetical protein [Pseudomonadota bacterium]MBU1697736.1 hypothetical protein [Pseudomonadota bacterium]